VPLVATTTEHPARPGYGRLILHGLREAKRDHVTNVAAALAYYGFLAVPSGLLVLLGAFTLVAQPSDVTRLLTHLQGIVPDSAISLLEDSLVRMTSSQQNGGVAMIVVGLLVALWTLTGAMTTLMWALNIAFDREESRGFVRQRLVAVAMLFLVLLAAILAFALLVLGPQLQEWLGNAVDQRTAVTWAWWIAEWPILLAAMLVAFVGVLYLGPSGDKSHRGLVSIGGLVTVVIWLAASGGFAFYASHFSSYNKTWGSLSAVIVMLTWIWLSSLALLIGAEIEAAILRGGSRAATAAAEPAAPVQPAERQPNATSAA
jgi:membrane protein